MSNVDAMRRLKGDIIASYDARVATVEEIVNNTQETLGRFHQEQQGRADELKEMSDKLRENLAYHESVRLSAFGFLLDEIRTQRIGRKSELESTLSEAESSRLATFRSLLDTILGRRRERKSEVESTLSEAEASRTENFKVLLNDIQSKQKEREEQVTSFLEVSRNEHQEMANALNEALANARADRSEAEAARLEEFKVLLNSYKEEIDGMAATWRNFSKIMQQRRAGVPQEAPPVKEEAAPEVEEEVPVEAAVPAEPAEEEAPPVEEEATPEVEEEVPVEAAVPVEKEAAPAEEREELQNRMLSTISSRPNGIRLVDIGEELSVAWRSLIPLARNLVESGQVAKVDVLYYPAGSGLYLQVEEQEAEEESEEE
jgi:nucleoid DNA-binding protein